MKILAFSDLHRDKRATERIVDASAHADVLVGAGDFANYCEGLSDCIDILHRSKAPVVLVPGNHERHDDLADLCGRFTNMHVLHGDELTLNGVSFFGLGAEIPSRNDATWNQTLSEDAARKILLGAAPFDILITHTPPLGCGDVQRDGTHEGSQAIADALLERRPKLHLCGHIHYSWGASGVVGDTYVRNLGPTVNWFTQSRPLQ